MPIPWCEVDYNRISGFVSFSQKPNKYLGIKSIL